MSWRASPNFSSDTARVWSSSTVSGLSRPTQRDPETFRGFLHELAARLSALPTTSFWVGEYDGTDTSDDARVRRCRCNPVAGHRPGSRPRPPRPVGPQTPRQWLAVGQARLPTLLRRPRRFPAHGRPRRARPIWRCPTNACPPASRHWMPWSPTATTAALRPCWPDLPASARRCSRSTSSSPARRRGETGLIATFQENPTQLERILQRVLVVAGRSGHRAHVPQPSRSVSRRMGLRPAGHRAPHRRHQGRHRQPGRPASRLPETKFVSASTSTRCCSAAPAPTSSVVMTQEVPELFGVTRLSEYGISHLSDNVILLQFLRGDSQLKRALTVLKSRGSAHEPNTRQYEITTDGVTSRRPVRPQPGHDLARRPFGLAGSLFSTEMGPRAWRLTIPARAVARRRCRSGDRPRGPPSGEPAPRPLGRCERLRRWLGDRS